MTIVALIVLVVLALIAFKFVKGVIKLGTLAILVMMCVIVAKKAGAF